MPTSSRQFEPPTPLARALPLPLALPLALPRATAPVRLRLPWVPQAAWRLVTLTLTVLLAAGAVRAEMPDETEPAATVAAPALDAQASTVTAAELFQDADLGQGEALIAEGDCTACHIRNVGGDGLAIYRPQGRINSPSFLRGMVEYCNTQLNLQLFPEDVSSIAAVLNRDHYHFK